MPIVVRTEDPNSDLALHTALDIHLLRLENLLIAEPLSEGAVHIWQIALHSRASLRDAWHLLSDDERSRANRFQSKRHARRFVIGRAAMRRILASYLRKRPAEVAFEYSRWGKPRLRESERNSLDFNFSHSASLALLAVTQRARIGVDVERLRGLQFDGLIEQACSISEAGALRRMCGREKAVAFFRCWTAKEAVIKACGKGFSLPINSFEVSFLPNEPISLVAACEREISRFAWHMASVDVPVPYIATVAVRRSRDESVSGDNQTPL